MTNQLFPPIEFYLLLVTRLPILRSSAQTTWWKCT